MTSSTPAVPPLEFALFRILGNSLPPRHGPDEVLSNLRFTLAHEPELEGCEKHWVLNRIADAKLEQECMALIRAAGHGLLHLPFELDRYALRFCDISGLPPAVQQLDLAQGEAAFAASTFALEWQYRHKSLYAIGLNEARNLALVAGRAKARWTLPWDGACFLTRDAWEAVRRLAREDASALHLVVPLARVHDNQALLADGFHPTDLTEPQLGFRHDSTERFDERLRYGNLNKAALLARLGVPGPWAAWRGAPWDAPPAREPSAERGRFVQGGWVGRLQAECDPSVEGDERQRWRARFLGVQRLCRQLDTRVVAQHHLPGRLLCYPEPALVALQFQDVPAVRELVAQARAAMAAPLPSVFDKTGCAPGGERADYFSLAPYFHLDGGMLLQRDGVRSAAANDTRTDRAALDRLVHGACATAMAGALTGDKAFFAHTARLLRTWFIDPATRMNPHMRFAQVAPGHDAGSPWGIVDFRGFWPLLDAASLAWRADALDEGEWAALAQWFGAFLDDVLARRIGNEPNNVAVWHDLVVVAVAAFTGRYDRAAEVLAEQPLRLAAQLSAFGVPVNELGRTRPLHYGLFLAQALSGVAALGRELGVDLWRCQASQQRSIAMLLRFLALNRTLLADHASTPEALDRRIAAAIAQVPEDAAHAEALAGLCGEAAAAERGDPAFGEVPFRALVIAAAQAARR